jgi:hypothetical protein
MCGRSAASQTDSSGTLWATPRAGSFTDPPLARGPDPHMTSVAITAVRVLVTLMAVVATVGQVAYLDALSWHKLGLAAPMYAQMSPPFLMLMVMDAAVSVVSAGMAVALALDEGPRAAAARGLGLAFVAWSYLTAYSGVTLLLRPNAGVLRSVFEGHFLAVEVVGLIGLLRFTALFPTPVASLTLPEPPTLPAVLKPLHSASVWMLRPAAPWLAGLVVLVFLWAVTALRSLPLGDAGLSSIMDLVRLLTAGLVVVNLRRSWTRAASDVAGEMTWLLVALVFLLGVLLVVIGANVLMGVTEWPEPPFAWRALLMDVGILGFLIAMAMSILYHGAMSAANAARRIAALAALATSGLFLAAGLEALFHGGMLGGLSARTGVGTLIAFVILVSTHRGILRSLERLFAQLPVPGIAEEEG